MLKQVNPRNSNQQGEEEEQVTPVFIFQQNTKHKEQGESNRGMARWKALVVKNGYALNEVELHFIIEEGSRPRLAPENEAFKSEGNRSNDQAIEPQHGAFKVTESYSYQNGENQHRPFSQGSNPLKCVI